MVARIKSLKLSILLALPKDPLTGQAQFVLHADPRKTIEYMSSDHLGAAVPTARSSGWTQRSRWWWSIWPTLPVPLGPSIAQ